jgi:uncharacterized protein YbcV (DUF1398 family)
MFTIEQIKTAHAKVKSGADFPAYIQEIKKLGVRQYTCFVTDGRTVYKGEEEFTAESPAKYAPLPISSAGQPGQLAIFLREHQQGLTGYLTFCQQAAEAGVENWKVDLEQMSCTYFDKAGNIMLAEEIPVAGADKN